MKKSIFTLFLSALLISCSQTTTGSQTENDQTKTAKSDSLGSTKTKMEVFASKTGEILKFTDYNFPQIKTAYSTAETRVRKVNSGSETAYFYQIERKGTYSDKTASIEYTDLLEVIKAIGILKGDVVNDSASKPDYLENKFVTVDGFQVGYFISEGKATWYLKLEKYGSDNNLFIDDVATIEKAFIDAKMKIEELKK